MADAATITAIVMAVAALLAALTPVVVARRRSGRQRDATVLASFTALNDALGEDVSRLRADIVTLRADYEQQLSSARRRITELEAEVAMLQRALRGQAP